MTETAPILKIRSIITLESNFKRLPNVMADGTEVFDANMEIHAGEGEEKDVIFTDLVVTSRLRHKEAIQAEAQIRMIGVFIVKNASAEEKRNCAFINCPAIMFPFIREHITSLFVRSGLKPYMLDPVNFVKLATEKQNQNPETKTTAEIPK